MTDRLSEIRERHNKATPGKMETGCGLGIYRRGRDGFIDWSAFDIDHEIADGNYINTLIKFKRAEDADFYIHAPEDIRYLLDEVERLQEAVKSHQKVIGLYLDVYGPTGGQGDG